MKLSHFPERKKKQTKTTSSCGAGVSLMLGRLKKHIKINYIPEKVKSLSWRAPREKNNQCS
jgi:hypothetical protein